MNQGNYSSLVSHTSTFGRNVFEYQAFADLLAEIGFVIRKQGDQQFKVLFKYNTNKNHQNHPVHVKARIQNQTKEIDEVIATLSRLVLQDTLNSAWLV